MKRIDRRLFLAGGMTAAAGGLLAANGSAAVDEVLKSGIGRRKIPAVVGMVAGPEKTLYSGAFGAREKDGPPVKVDSIFRIASMTKAVTTVAALQLVEQGKVGLDEPVARHLPQFSKVQVLQGFDEQGKATLKPANTPPTLRHLLTHTSGLCYDIWDEQMFRYAAKAKVVEGEPETLMFEPGKRWQYGQSLDWAGRLVEAVSGLTLEEYFQRHIFQPLVMEDTSFVFPEAKFERLVTGYHREGTGDLKQDARKMPSAPKSFNGGGGLYSTAADYVRFMQMILKHGEGLENVRILRTKTVESMTVNQIGGLTAGKMKSFRPNLSSDVDIQPGHSEKWGLGFLINTTAYEGGRRAGSLAWAGMMNTYYWIDLKKQLCAVLMMQFLPFVDREAVGLLNDFERAVYRSL